VYFRCVLTLSKLFNKFLYSHVGTRELIVGACKNLHERIKLYCDGKPIELPYLEGLTIINIPSQAGGTDYWGNHLIGSGRADNLARQSISDQIIEVIGLSGMIHMGQCMIGLDGGIRICQGKTIRLIVDPKQKVPMQIDGEPFTHADGGVIVDVEFDTQIRMLKRVSSNATAIEKKCYGVIEWAKQNGHISADQALIIETEMAKTFNK